MADVLVQTVLPQSLATWVKRQATKEGLSVAAWVRRILMLQHRQAFVPAWARHPNETKSQNLQNIWASAAPPTFFLEQTNSGYSAGDGSIEFRVFGRDGRSFTDLDLADEANGEVRYFLGAGWLIVGGSLEPWIVVHSMSDVYAKRQLLLRIRPTRTGGQRTFDVTPSWWRDSSVSDAQRAVARGALPGLVPSGTIFTESHPSELSFTLTEHSTMTDAQAIELQRRVRETLQNLR